MKLNALFLCTISRPWYHGQKSFSCMIEAVHEVGLIVKLKCQQPYEHRYIDNLSLWHRNIRDLHQRSATGVKIKQQWLVFFFFSARPWKVKNADTLWFKWGRTWNENFYLLTVSFKEPNHFMHYPTTSQNKANICWFKYSRQPPSDQHMFEIHTGYEFSHIKIKIKRITQSAGKERQKIRLELVP